MKKLALLSIIAALTGCTNVPNPDNESFGHALARGMVRMTTEKTYYNPYLGTARDSRVEESIFGSRTP